MAHSQRYEVAFEVDGRTGTAVVFAQSVAMAARMAEETKRGVIATAVTTTWEVVGRCSKCHGIVFEGERPRSRFGKFRCNECA